MDAIKSIQDSHNNGWADLVIAMTINVRTGTLIEVEKRHGLYKLPSIWAVAEVMKGIGFDLASRTKFLGFSISEYAKNEGTETVSGQTEDEVKLAQKILSFNGLKKDYDEIVGMTEAGAVSDGYKQWKTGIESQKPSSTVAERIASHIALLSKIYKPQ